VASIDIKPIEYMFFNIFFNVIHCFFEILSRFNIGLIWNVLLAVTKIKLFYYILKYNLDFQSYIG